MTHIDTNKPVLVTGATGYVAGWIVKELLEMGVTVHAPIRNPDNREKTKHLDALVQKFGGAIKYFKADLLQEGSYDEAMEGCELVFHTASPFSLKVKDPQRDLVDPALKGTRNVLSSVERNESVKRVVLTSSCAAILGDNKDIIDYKGQVATEENWNESSSLAHNPYSYSKTLAEKAAWAMARAQGRWDLVVVNPSLVIGPGLNPNGTSESFHIVRQLGNGEMKFGAPDLHIGVNDVRDLAMAHVQAGFTPEAEGRHIIQAKALSLLDLANMLREKYGDKYPLPRRTLPKWLVWLMAPTVGVTRKFVKNNIGYEWKVDGSKSVRELGISYRPVKESISEMFDQLFSVGS